MAPSSVALEPVPGRSPQHLVVANAIRMWVFAGAYGPGERLPPERTLAVRLGVGRKTLRAAIRQLNDEGLLTTTRGRSGGSVVTDGVSLDPDSRERTRALVRDAAHAIELRSALESLAARLAASRATESQLATLAAMRVQRPASLREFRALDASFHRLVGEASANPRLVDAILRARAEFFTPADAAFADIPWDLLPPQMREFYEQHRAVAEAIRRRRPDQAAAAMHAHVHEGSAALIEVLDRLREADGAATRADGPDDLAD